MLMMDEVVGFAPGRELRQAAGGEGRVVVVAGVDHDPELCRGVRMLAQRHPTVRFAMPAAEGVFGARFLAGLTNLTLLPVLEPAGLAWLLTRAQLVLSHGGALADAGRPVVELPTERHALVAATDELVAA